MAELNDLTVRGDSLLQGDCIVNGVLNGVKTITDNDTLIIDVIKKIDLTTTGVKAEIEIPSGFVGMPTFVGSEANISLNTYLFASNTSGSNAGIKVSFTDASNNTAKTSTGNVQLMSDNTFALIPFCKGKITVEVTSASDSLKCALITRIYCLKQ